MILIYDSETVTPKNSLCSLKRLNSSLSIHRRQWIFLSFKWFHAVELMKLLFRMNSTQSTVCFQTSCNCSFLVFFSCQVPSFISDVGALTVPRCQDIGNEIEPWVYFLKKFACLHFLLSKFMQETPLHVCFFNLSFFEVSMLNLIN